MSMPPSGSQSALQAIGWPPAHSPVGAGWRAIWQTHPGTRPARVITQHRSGYLVAEGPAGGFAAASPPEWRGTGRHRLDPLTRATVGDWVLLEDECIIALLPRHNAIMRAAASEDYRQQLIAANIDVALILCGLDNDFNPRRIERYLLLAQGQGPAPEPVIVLTKADLPGANGAGACEALAAITAQGVALVLVDARDPCSAGQLTPWLAPGMTAVLVGSSGAGKSTLTNTLSGQSRMKTGEVRANDARGRHTTTHRALIPLSSGACLIDTPGMRALKPTGKEDVNEGGFSDIEALAGNCHFHDCRHQAEPDCAVRAAVAAGTLDPARLAHYRKLRDALTAAVRQQTGRKDAPRAGRR